AVAIEGEEMVQNAVFQAGSSLERPGFSLVEAEGDTLTQLSPVLRAALSEGMVRITEGRSVRKGRGTYFLQDGTQVDGEVLFIGNVASYGLSNAGIGALKPVGKDRLQLWRDGGTDTATALAAGAVPGSGGIFLYEAASKAITEAPEKTWAGYVDAGGPAGLVIIGLGFLAVILVVVRAVSLSVLAGSGTGFVHAVAGKLRSGEQAAAVALAKTGKGAIGRVTEAIASNFSRPRDELEDVVGEAILGEQPRVDRLSTAILVIAAVAPLLGLLGTVTGMIATFDIITEFGTGDPRRLSGGISEALVTTQLGLIVAIPALLVGNVLSAWGNSVMGRIERAALHLLNVERVVQPTPDESGEPVPQLREVAQLHG
ncbi:MAG: MotA/TolQ/ExbB proton channel family protein, partial [Myxococcota bacterium]